MIVMFEILGVLGMWKDEDLELKVSFGYIVRLFYDKIIN